MELKSKMKFFLFLIFIVQVIGCENSTKNSDKSEYNTQKEEIINYKDTSNKIMNEDEFWKIISQSSDKNINNYEGQKKSLKLILSGLDTSDVSKFGNKFYQLLNDSYNWDLWAASYVINGGCSDDCFDYFREYLISRGKLKFYQTLKNPDSCADWIKSESEENWEGISYAAFEIYKEKTGKDLILSIPLRQEIDGDPFDEFTLGEKYPKLSKKFNYDTR